MDPTEGPLNLQLPIEERNTGLRSSLTDLEVADSDIIASGLESHPSADHSKGRISPILMFLLECCALTAPRPLRNVLHIKSKMSALSALLVACL